MSKSQKFVHRGYHYDRTTIDDRQGRLEKAAADYWEKGTIFCALPVPYVSLLRVKITGNPFNPFNQNIEVPETPLTQEEATAMATVFQWVFTPVGRSALYEVYKAAGWSIEIEPLKEVKEKSQGHP